MRLQVPCSCLVVGLAVLSACGKEEGGAGAELTVTVTVTASGDGTGSVTSTPPGIDCGSDCSEVIAEGTSMTLHATAGEGSTFAGWSGGGCDGTGDCVLDLVADTTADAQFTRLGLSCTLVTNADYCTNGAIPPIDLGPITSAECHSQCQGAMPAAGMTSGCWILATDTHCYCRSGSLSTGSSRPGGTCTSPSP